MLNKDYIGKIVQIKSGEYTGICGKVVSSCGWADCAEESCNLSVQVGKEVICLRRHELILVTIENEAVQKIEPQFLDAFSVRLLKERFKLK